MRPILVGIAQAIACTKTLWTPTTNMNYFAKMMRAIIKFANLIVVPSRKILDLDKVPQVRKKLDYRKSSIRSRPCIILNP